MAADGGADKEIHTRTVLSCTINAGCNGSHAHAPGITAVEALDRVLL
jgi:hypothetical protein